MTIADIGACVGDITRLMKLYLKDSTVHMFEPLQDLNLEGRTLKAAMEKFKDIHLHPLLIGDQDANTVFYRTEKADDSSMLRPLSKKINKTIEMPMVRLDTWSDSNNTDFDLIKLDIQGAELRALKGMTELLKKARFIYTEISFQPMYKGQPSFYEIGHFLKKHDYGLFHMYDISIESANVLFIRGFMMQKWSDSYGILIRK